LSPTAIDPDERYPQGKNLRIYLSRVNVDATLDSIHKFITLAWSNVG